MRLEDVDVIGSVEWLQIECSRCHYRVEAGALNTVAEFVAAAEHRCTPVIEAGA